MAGAINIKFGASVGDFLSGMGQMGTSVSKFAAELNGNLAASYASADRNQKVFNRGFGRLASDLQGVGTKLSTYVTLPLLGVAGGAIKMAGDLEKAKVSFTVMLGSAEKASAVLAGLQKFAADTPFEFPEIQGAAKSLLAFGITADKLQPTLKSLGDISAGIDAPIGEIAQIFGKARVQGRLFAEDINQLTGRGIPVIGELAKQFGVTEGAVKKLVEDGRVNFGNLEQAFTNLTKKGSQFGGLMEAQSKTLPGLISTFTDNAGQSLAKLGTDLVDAFNIKGVLANVSEGIAAASNVFQSLSPSSKTAVFSIAGVAAAIGPLTFALGGLIKILPTVKLGFAALTGPIGLVTVAVVGAALLIISNWEAIRGVLVDSGIWQTVTNLVSGAMNSVKSLISAGVSFATAVWNEFGGRIINIIKGSFTAVAGIVKGALGVVGVAFTTGLGVITGIIKIGTGLFTGNWQKMAEGFQNITASLWNGVLGLFIAGAKATGGVIAGFLESVGAVELASKVNGQLNKITAGANGLKIALQETQKVAKDGIALPEVTVTAKKQQTTTSAPLVNTGALKKDKENFGALIGRQVELANNELTDLQARIANFTFLGITPPRELTQRLSDLRLELKKNEDAINALKAADTPIKRTGGIGALAENLQTENERVAKFTEGLKARLADLRQFGSLDFYQEQISKVGAEIQKLTLKNLEVPASAIGDMASYIGQVNKANLALKEAQVTANELQFGEADRAATITIGGFDLSIFKRSKEQLFDELESMKSGIGQALETAAESALIGMGNVVGSLLAGTTGIEDVGRAISGVLLGSFGNLLTQLGEIAIQTAIGIGAIKTALTTFNPVLVAAAGVALIGFGALIKSQVSSLGATPFANGGLVYGPTLGLVGEGRGTNANNPEVIAPLDKLKALLPKSGGSAYIPDIMIEGSALRLVLNRADAENASY